ncbi:MAG: YceI family protein [Pseudomonadota bacterium]|nr:YceI family protein [Pseudomonadota bacterium]
MKYLAALLICACIPSAWAAETFTLDPGHTFPSFEIRHHEISLMRGKFNRSQGKVMLDAEKQIGAIEIRVDATSGDSGHEGLNQKLLGANFFRTTQFPEILFSSGTVEFKDGKPVSATGNLTLLGVTKPVTLEIRDYGCTLQFLSRRPLCGADVHAVIKRSDFGMNYGIPLIGDEVKLAIEVEGFKDNPN